MRPSGVSSGKTSAAAVGTGSAAEAQRTHTTGGEQGDPSLAQPSPEAPELWALASGKGGVGRSFLSANLGFVLARQQRAVTLVDTDFGGGNLHTFLGTTGTQAGLDRFLRGEVEQLESLARPLDLPQLRLIAGPQELGEAPPAARRRQLRQGLRSLSTPMVLLDLAGGCSTPVLELFSQAHKPLLVVLPEPASVEDAHMFVRRWYGQRVMQEAGKLGIGQALFRQQVLRGGMPRPPELLSRVDALQPGAAHKLHQRLSLQPLSLVLNQVRHISDVTVGLSLKQAMQNYFELPVRFVGAIGYDAEAWLSARRRRLRARESSAETLHRQLSELIQHLQAGTELELPEDGHGRDG